MPPDPHNTPRPEDWSEYRRLILQELERLNMLAHDLSDEIRDIRNKDLSQVRIDIAMLQVKAGVWGAVAGAVIALGAIFLRKGGF